MYTEGIDTKEIAWGNWLQDMETLTHRGIRFGLKPIKQIISNSRYDFYLHKKTNPTPTNLFQYTDMELSINSLKPSVEAFIVFP
jgi:hypothetical protein